MERFWKYKGDHITFWVTTVAFHMYTRMHLVDQAGFVQFLLEITIRNVLLAAVIYTNLLILIPRLIFKRNYFAYGLALLLFLFLYAISKHIHDVHLYANVLGQPERISLLSNVFYNLSIAVFYVSFSIALQLSREWYNQRELIRKIEIEKLNTELAYLKAQMNPHFLFNSINTIYFQIDKTNEEARSTLSTFSEMLRYQLYECNGHEVPVEKEVRYLQNYIDLQRLRKDTNYSIMFCAAESVKGFTIAPLLLICFVENAFKYVSHNTHNNEITVQLNRVHDRFIFKVFNTCEAKCRAKADSSGIGLKNVQRRLDLLYKDRYQLNVSHTHDNFLAELILTIK